jgi:aryl-alcohol dehydrogenase-like predicted oxidoreductase
MSTVVHKIGLGTVQFGLDYGISNSKGQTSPQESALVLDHAAASGVRLLDTAPAYGDSELTIGRLHAGRFRIVTKTVTRGTGSFSAADVQSVERTFQDSLSRLRADRVYGLLVHDVRDLLGDGSDLLYACLSQLKRRGLVEKIGVSTYTPAEVDSILARFSVDLIQVPLNVLDQRLLRGGQIRRLKQAGVEVHVRSAFLQGLLLMNPNDLQPHFDGVRDHLRSYHAAVQQSGRSPLQASLGFVLGIPEIDAVVCGVNDVAQFEQIVAKAVSLETDWFERFAIDDESVLNPALWPAAPRRQPLETSNATA